MTRLKNLAVIAVMYGVISSCNGLETDISKKLDFVFNISGLDSVYYDTLATIGIASHDEIDDYVDYAVYPAPFRINEVSFKVESVSNLNRSNSTNLKVSYRTPGLDTVSLFDEPDLPIAVGERTTVNVDQSKLTELTTLTNDFLGFDLVVETDSDLDSAVFQLLIYFDTTIAIDYDL